MTRASEAPALSYLCVRRDTRQGKTFHNRRSGLIFPGTEREEEELVPSLLCQHAEGGEELTQAV
jgi:hypothetical protein